MFQLTADAVLYHVCSDWYRLHQLKDPNVDNVSCPTCSFPKNPTTNPTPTPCWSATLGFLVLSDAADQSKNTFHFTGCLGWCKLALFKWDVPRLPSVPSWHLPGGVRWKGGFAYQTAVKPSGEILYSHVSQWSSLLFVYVLFFRIMVILSVSNQSVRIVYKRRRRNLRDAVPKLNNK